VCGAPGRVHVIRDGPATNGGRREQTPLRDIVLLRALVLWLEAVKKA
jgi:hypothetical protein